MNPRLLPFQEEGRDFLAARTEAFLADEMSLGKTLQAITALDRVGARRVVILALGSTLTNWQRQVQNWSLFLDPSVIDSAKDVEHIGARDCVILSYPRLIRLAALKALCARRWDTLVIDEAHRLKDKDAAQTKAAYKYLRPQCGRVWRLSASPRPNHAGEWWSHLASAGIYSGTYNEFLQYFCNGYEAKYGWRPTTVQADKREELQSLLRGFVLRRTAKEVGMQLPELLPETIFVKKNPIKLEGFDLARAEEEQQTVETLVLGGHDVSRVFQERQPQTAELRRLLGLQKLEAYIELIESELTENESEKLMVFFWHREVGERLVEAMKPFGAQIYYGGMSAKAKARAKEAFQEDPKCRVLAGQMLSCGTGTDGLQIACSWVDILEPDFVPDNNVQALRRIARYGGKSNFVRARYITANDSLDEAIARTNVRKTEDAAKDWA